MDEKDRSTQKRGEATAGRAGGAGALGSTHSASDGSSQLSLEISVSRPAEIEAALQQFVSPKVTVTYSTSFCTRGHQFGQTNGDIDTSVAPLSVCNYRHACHANRLLRT